MRSIWTWWGSFKRRRELCRLKHARRMLPGGGMVLVLDTGAVITPEDTAMLQALHSRSVGGVEAHLQKLAKKGSGGFMDQYYIGYGDKSIGDCGSATIFIEGVSMLAAKAVQDSLLYNGQESSTRYVDFSKQPFCNRGGCDKGAEMLERLRAFYLAGLEEMREHLAKAFPYDEKKESDQKKWRKAINARAFDVMRAFLPAGAVTNLSWHTELRHAADHLLRLRNHRLGEARGIADAAHGALEEVFPHTFGQKRYEATESYTDRWMNDMYYYTEVADIPSHGVLLKRDSVDRALLVEEYAPFLRNRPPKTELPKVLAECGTMQFSFLLDFGSFRDLQRHRSMIQRMPLVSIGWGFEEWYFLQMPGFFSLRARAFLEEYEKDVRSLRLPPLVEQYYIPMGYRVPCRITGDIPSLVWVVELRSGAAVHPTLRAVAQGIGRILRDRLPGIRIHMDENPDQFCIRRGEQDIVEK